MSYPQHPENVNPTQPAKKSGYQPMQYPTPVVAQPYTQQQPYQPINTQQFYGQTQPSLPSSYQKALIPIDDVRKMQRRKTVTTVSVIIGSFLLSLILGLAALTGGSITFFLALIPLSLVVSSTFWIGRWDPEPGFMRIIAFLWGSVGSVIFTMLVTLLVVEPIFSSNQFSGAVVQAPIVEELAKGIFVLTIALFFKRYMNSPVDGIVYILLVASGFAFTENILYFSQSLAAGGTEALSQTFVLRGILSPFAHSLFSLPMGILLGLAVRKHYKTGKIMLMFLAGYVPAMCLHALWNGSSYFIADMNLWFLFYGIVQLPLFIGAAFIVMWLRQQEALRTYKYLTAYAHKGWFTVEELQTFASFPGRSYINKWAKTKRNPQAVYLVKKINKNIVNLTIAREDIVLHKNKHDSVRKQEELLNVITADKQLLAQF